MIGGLLFGPGGPTAALAIGEICGPHSTLGTGKPKCEYFTSPSLLSSTVLSEWKTKPHSVDLLSQRLFIPCFYRFIYLGI